MLKSDNISNSNLNLEDINKESEKFDNTSNLEEINNVNKTIVSEESTEIKIVF